MQQIERAVSQRARAVCQRRHGSHRALRRTNARHDRQCVCVGVARSAADAGFARQSLLHAPDPAVDRRFGVSVLAEDQDPLSNHFAGRRSPGSARSLRHRNDFRCWRRGRIFRCRGDRTFIRLATTRSTSAAWSISRKAKASRCSFIADDTVTYVRKRACRRSGLKMSFRYFDRQCGSTDYV